MIVSTVNDDVTLSAKGQQIAETVKLEKLGLTVSNAGAEDTLDLLNALKANSVTLTATSNTNFSDGSAIAALDNAMFITVKGSYLDNDLTIASTVAEFLENATVGGVKHTLATGNNFVIALNNTKTGKAYYYQALGDADATKIIGSELTLLGVTDNLANNGTSLNVTNTGSNMTAATIAL